MLQTDMLQQDCEMVKFKAGRFRSRSHPRVDRRPDASVHLRPAAADLEPAAAADLDPGAAVDLGTVAAEVGGATDLEPAAVGLGPAEEPAAA